MSVSVTYNYLNDNAYHFQRLAMILCDNACHCQ